MRLKPQLGKTYLLTDGREFTPVKMEQKKFKCVTKNQERTYIDADGNRVKKRMFKEEKV